MKTELSSTSGYIQIPDGRRDKSVPMSTSQQLAHDRQSLVSVEERLRLALLHRDYPPQGLPHSAVSSSTIREELRDLYVSRAHLLQLIQHLESQEESTFKNAFRSVLKAEPKSVRAADTGPFPGEEPGQSVSA
jgi:hypothetical protein